MRAGDNALRTELSRIINCSPVDVVGEERVGAWLRLQVQKISTLNEKFPHSILIETPWSNDITGLNCYMHALGLNPEAIKDWRWPGIQPDTPFVGSIVDNLLVEKSLSEATDGDIVIYFDKERPRHAGRFSDKKIISKWGDGATNIWKHDLWEVPSDYGGTARAFRPLSEEQAAEAHIEWAKAQ